MALGQADLKQIADAILNSVNGVSSSGTANYQRSEKTDGSAGGGKADEMINASKLERAEIKKLNKTMKQLVKEGFDMQSVEKLPEEMRKSLSGVNTKFAKKLSDSIKTLEDAFKVQDKIDAGNELVVELKKFKKGEEVTLENFERLNKIAKRAGITANEFIDAETKTIKGIEKLDAEFTELSTSVDNASQSAMRNSRGLNKLTALYQIHGRKLKEATLMYVEELRIARERAVHDAQYTDAMFRLGLSMKDYSVILADNRDTQQAMSAGGRDFTDELVSGTNEMSRYSRDRKQAAETTAAMLKGLTGFGVKSENLGGALSEQTAMYKDNFRIWGDTAEQFAKMTVSLTEDLDIRSNLSMMQESQRKEYILGIQAQMSYRRELGYTQEQALELAKTFAKMGAESPKERMKKAAKQRALMGTLGMGAEGAELQQLMTTINQKTGDDRIAAENRIEEIQRQMSNLLQGKYSQGLGTEMFFRSMADKAGVTEMARNRQTETLEGKTKDKKAEQARADEREVPLLLSKGIDIWDGFNAFQSTSVGLLTGILAALIGGKAFSMIGGLLGKSMGKLTGGIAKMGSTIAKGLGMGGAAAAVAADVGTKGAGSAAAAAAKVGGKTAAKTISKGVIKSGIKKIPIIGALAGIGFGISRAMDGDMVGAGLEVASGVASILPGWGTAASVAIDAGLAARDLTSSDDNVGRSAGGNATAATSSQATQELNTITMQAQQMETMVNGFNELTAYIKDVNNQSSELADSTNNLANEMNESNRVAGFNASRPA